MQMPDCEYNMLEVLMSLDDFGLIILNENFDILQFSHGAEKIIGIGKDEVIGTNIRKLVPEQFHKAHEEYIANFINGPLDKIKISKDQFIPIANKNNITKAEFIITRHNLPNGQKLFSVIINDISDKVKLTEDVKVSGTRLRSAVNADGMTVFEIDYDCRKISYFGVLEEMFRDADTPEKFKELIFQKLSKQSALKLYDVFRQHLENHIPISMEIELINHDNTSNWYNIYAEMLYNNEGKRHKFVGALKNVTENKLQQLKIDEEMKKAREAGEAKTKLLAAVSHEMRTPLNGIFGGLQQLELFNLNEKDNSNIDMIEKSAKRLLSVVDELLGLENRDNSHDELFAKSFEINPFCELIFKQFNATCTAKSLRFNIINNCEQYNVSLNQNQLLLIVENLVQNAIKYTPSGSVTTLFDRNDDGLMIEIIDTGIGISNDNLAIIKETLENGHDSLPETFAGSGIGLIAAYRLIESLGGKLEIESILNQGTNMRILLPAKFVPSPLNKVGGGKNSEVNETCEELGVCALIAEDNETNQAVLKAFMDAMEINNNIVANGLEALNSYIVFKYDFILMDIKMPEMDGKEATRRIRQYEKVNNLPRVPIIAVTANALPHQMEEYLACGMDAVVTKPVSAPQLYQAIDDAMETCENFNQTKEDNKISA